MVLSGAMMRRGAGQRAADGEALWRFSLALYARPGVADALLALQDRAGRNVDLMLFLLWLGAARGRRIKRGELAAAEAAIAPVGAQVVGPVRRLRRALKAAAEPDLQVLRRRLATLEVAAERHVLARLAAGASRRAAARPAEDRLAAARANLALYLADVAGSREAMLICQALAMLARAPTRGIEDAIKVVVPTRAD